MKAESAPSSLVLLVWARDLFSSRDVSLPARERAIRAVTLCMGVRGAMSYTSVHCDVTRALGGSVAPK